MRDRKRRYYLADCLQRIGARPRLGWMPWSRSDALNDEVKRMAFRRRLWEALR